MQGEFPAVDTGLLRDFAGRILGVVGQAGQHHFIGDHLAKGVGGVEQVFRELGGQLRKLFHDRLVARLLVFRQLGAAEAEIADFVIDDLPAFGAQRGVFRAGLEGAVFVEQLQVLSEFGVEARYLGQHLVVGLAPGRHIVDRVQVTDHAPGTAEAFQPVGQRTGEVGPSGRGAIVRQAFDQRTAVGEQGFDGGFDVFRLDQVEAGQVGEVEQRIVGLGHGRRGQ